MREISTVSRNLHSDSSAFPKYCCWYGCNCTDIKEYRVSTGDPDLGHCPISEGVVRRYCAHHEAVVRQRRFLLLELQ